MLTALCPDFVPPFVSPIEMQSTNYSDKFLHMVGDGNCNDITNIEAYDYDGGDCCNDTSYYGIPHCAQCKCMQYEMENPYYKSWAFEFDLFGDRLLVNYAYGDGFCDDALNTAEHFYDLGDCCIYEELHPMKSLNSFFCFNCTCIPHKEFWTSTTTMETTTTNVTTVMTNTPLSTTNTMSTTSTPMTTTTL